MGAHTVVLDLLQIPYEKVNGRVLLLDDVFLCHCLTKRLCSCVFGSASAQSDEKMNEVMTLAHTFLQNFCKGNPQNQVLLHKHFNLFLTPGVCGYDPGVLLLC